MPLMHSWIYIYIFYFKLLNLVWSIVYMNFGQWSWNVDSCMDKKLNNSKSAISFSYYRVSFLISIVFPKRKFVCWSIISWLYLLWVAWLVFCKCDFVVWSQNNVLLNTNVAFMLHLDVKGTTLLLSLLMCSHVMCVIFIHN